ncbi:HD domain-containing protein [Pseudomonas sp. S2_B07]
MSLEQVKRTSIWRNAFEGERSLHSDEVSRLKAEFLRFREKVAMLVSKIGEVLPGLTVHDVSHLDALWTTADIIAGEDYPLNPLETFILGGAILLHDSAMCWEAYEGGQDGVRSTVVWKDAYAFELGRKLPILEAEAAADFSAIRQMHASRAAQMIGLSWKVPGRTDEIYLISDESIRMHLGELIGLIAASHHWDIGSVSERLSIQFNSPDFLPYSWTVDPIKIACLLRVADAAHISSARAPDFLLALNRRAGISLNHWLAQNKISGPQRDLSDSTGRSVVYTSTMPYLEGEADAWWVAYDTVLMIDSEIKACNELLEGRAPFVSRSFKVRTVAGAGRIDEFQSYIRVFGWTPYNTQLHVSDIERLVGSLGGEKLYGDDRKLEVVLRELIQNSRDAIVARRYLDEGYQGRIIVKFLRNQSGISEISISDDGVGMSKSVLTGSFLDFGSSFWSSQFLQAELPGLRSSKFQSIGQFGIGFYSIFMAASAVEVSTRRWRENRNYSCALCFSKGLTLRPLFKEDRSSKLPTNTSTEIRFALVSDVLGADACLPLTSNGRNAVKGRVPLKEFVSALVVGLDVDVFFGVEAGELELIHKDVSRGTLDCQSILREIGCGKKYPLGVEALETEINEAAPRMRVIQEDGRILGYAALACKLDSDSKMLGVKTIGGMVVSNSTRSEGSIIGYVECSPKTASRDINGFLASEKTMKEWAEAQLEFFESNSTNDLTRLVVASRASAFKADVIGVARLYVVFTGGAAFSSFEQIAQIAISIPVGFLLSPFLDGHIETHHDVNEVEGVAHVKPLINEGWLSFELDDDGLPKPDTIAAYIHRSILMLGFKPHWTIGEPVHKVHFGMSRFASVRAVPIITE